MIKETVCIDLETYDCVKRLKKVDKTILFCLDDALLGACFVKYGRAETLGHSRRRNNTR